MPNARLLVIQHEESCPPGWAGDWLTEAGVVLDVRQAWRGDVIPPRLTDHGGLLVLGGEMNAYADAAHPWLPATRALIARTVADGMPFLGICLGHQLATVALGGAVEAHPAGPDAA